MAKTFKRNILLKNYTTFKIGGPAKYFFEAKNKKDLVEAIKTAKELNPVRDYRGDKKAQRKQISNGVKLDFFILGGGGNVLVSDKGYDGLIIKVQSSKFKVQSYSSKFKVNCESGVILTKLVAESLKAGATGMEWAIGIPGTVGGAIRGNAGAFEQSMGQLVKKVEVYDLKDLKFKIYEKRNCQFKYRESIFKHKKNLIILSTELEMEKRDKKEIKKKIVENIKWRKEHQPLEYPSAGSIFKNPGKFSAGWLIEQCNLKGKKIGGAQISEKHANFIINLGNAKAADVKKLINLAKEKVKQKFGIILEEEIEYLK